MNRYFLLLCTIVILCHGFGEGGILTDLEKGLSNLDPLGDLKTQIENLEKNLSSLWSMVSDMNKNVKHDLHQLHLFQMEVNDKLKNFLGMPLKNEGKDMHHMNEDGLKHSDAEHSDHSKSYHGSFQDHHHDDRHHGGHHDDHHHGGHHDDHHHDHHGGHHDDYHHDDHHGYHGPHHYGSDVHSREDHHDSHEDHHDDSHHHNDSSHEHDDSHKGHDDHSDHPHGHDDHSDHHQGHDDHSDHHHGHDDHSDHHQGHDDHDDHSDHSSHDNSHHHHSDHHDTTTQTDHSHSDDHSQHKEVHNVSHDDHHHHHESHHDYHHHHHNQSHHSQSLNFDFAICNVTSNRAIPEEKQQNVTGLIRLWQKENGTLHVHIQLEGFKIHQHDSGDHKSDKHSHGFHVHRDGDLSNGCQSTGPHYNPLEVAHGGPKSPVRHVGDLGNIACDEQGVTNIVVTDEIASLQGPYSIIGKSLVVHEDVDDFGTNPDIPASISSGNAGSRIACCIIEKVERLPPPIRKEKTSHYHHHYHHSSHH
ncbi:uncharacterized protein [Centruroides vittatus]|uniref:uncharacterized protein n=1 Tax=Centruroides vittatus TaxID=120091 RepID=UPI00350FB171